jgi:hypothetical protein
MRQNLLGTSLLNGMMHNPAYPGAQPSLLIQGHPHHPGAHPMGMYGQYMPPPMGYEHPPHPGQPFDMHQGMYEAGEGMYRLPPIEGMDMVSWPHGLPPPQPGMEYYGNDPSHPHDSHQYPPEGYYHDQYHLDGMEYRLPPVAEGSMREAKHEEADQGQNPRMKFDWSKDQQTPSGHVMFQDKLFDGALDSAGLTGRKEADEGLNGFEEAVAQANEAGSW